MRKPPLLISVARPEDAQTWVQLGYPQSSAPPPYTLEKETASFNAPRPDVDEGRFIVWQGDTPVARAFFNRLDNVVELRDFVIAQDYANEYGAAILESIIEAARPRGNLLTIDYFPATYSKSFLTAGFSQNTRTRMTKSLAGYSAQEIILPRGIALRHPIFGDEPALAEAAFNNYRGTADEAMVSGGYSQAAAIMHAMLHNDYNLLIPNGSYLAEDADSKLAGDIILGDASNAPGDLLAWIMDISVAQAHRGKGLGRALLLSAINAAHEQGYPRVGLIVTIGNANAQALYHSVGFEAYGDLMYEAALRL